MADPDASKQMVVIPERDQLTMREAQSIGHAANRLARLQRLHKEAGDKGGKMIVGTGMTSLDIFLAATEMQAALAFLIERDQQFLASFNVKL